MYLQWNKLIKAIDKNESKINFDAVRDLNKHTQKTNLKFDYKKSIAFELTLLVYTFRYKQSSDPTNPRPNRSSHCIHSGDGFVASKIPVVSGIVCGAC